MALVAFLTVEPSLAAQETRTITLFEPHDGIPAGEYGLIEHYCPDPDHDCQRVLIQIVEKRHPRKVLAAISYGFDREAENAGPFVDPLNEQCRYAHALLVLVANKALADPSYVARLKRHYDLTKQAAADPQHPEYARLRKSIADDALPKAASREKRPRRNDPCPCGSGKKYKNCCMRMDRARPARIPGHS